MVVVESPLRDLLRLVVWYPLRWLVELLPPGYAFALLERLGDLHFALKGNGTLRRLAPNLERLRRGLGTRWKGREYRDLARAYLRNHYVDRLAIFIFPHLTPHHVEHLIRLEGREHLDNALRAGGGVILVHGHFGPVHLPLVTLGQLGYRMFQIGLPSDDGLSRVGRKVAFRLRMVYESRIPARIILADTFMRPVFRALKENGVVMITGDGTGTPQRVGQHETFEFCGHTGQFPLGPAILAEKTGAALLPMFILPGEPPYRYRIVIEPPRAVIQGERGLTRRLTREFLARLEHHIAQEPGYMHFLDRFAPGELLNDPVQPTVIEEAPPAPGNPQELEVAR